MEIYLLFEKLGNYAACTHSMYVPELPWLWYSACDDYANDEVEEGGGGGGGGDEANWKIR